ncbi:hypothetical protein HC62_06560 [Acetobacter tropicalis]|uniref:Membrane transport protein MMPL domain-containing protein n=2 Tax=Acetobacter tropicalis TaxID=104102 RepID=A0A252AA66_9PROT|nr:hypothetical protein HC62_06560 [Acetobacter tropicalis]
MALAASAIVTAVVFWFIPLRLDMAGFLPEGHNDGTRFLLREVQGGVAGTVLMLGIEGAPEPELARLSLGLQKVLSADPQFATVMNGVFSSGQMQALDALLMAHRYQLAPDDSVRDFSSAALVGAFETVLDGLGSSAGSVFSDMLMRDPTKAFLNAAQALEPDVHVRLQHGVWFAAAQPRALLLVRTRAPGMDLTRQKKVQQTLQSDFAALHPGAACLLMSGPSVFAIRSATGMRQDMDMMALCSLMLVAGVLYWRFRSLWVLAAIGVPFLLSFSAAMLVVRLVFGYVHGIALGFGMTMLGVALDYPVLLIGHRDKGEGPNATLHRIGQSLRLGVTSAVLGLTGMVFCGLPGLAQLGTFAATGLIVAACVTLFLMPRLVVEADLAPYVSGPSRPLEWAEQIRRYRVLGLVPVLVSAFWLCFHPPALDTRLAALSPIPEPARKLDDALRQELGVPDASLMLAVSGLSAQAVLEQEEALEQVWAGLRQQHALAGVQDAARFLPSIRMQTARMNALPAPEVLRAEIAEAQKTFPFKADAFAPFLHDVALARTLSPLSPQDMTGTPLEAALSPLLFEREGRWFGLVFPERVRNKSGIESAMSSEPDVMVVDMKREIDGLSAHYTARTLRWMTVGGILALGVLVYGLGSVNRILRVISSVGAALCTLLAVLAWSGQPLTLIHLISLQFVLGVSLDYALFFARPQLDDAERARTMRTLMTCNIMTVLTFGLLAACNTPLLQEIGKTVALGVALAMAYGFLFAGQRPETERATSL